MLANHVFWRLMLFNTHLLLLLQPSVLLLSIVSFNNDVKPPPKWIFREFDVSRIRPWLRGLPDVERLHGKICPRLRGLAGLADPTYHVSVIQLKWEIIWTGRLPHLPGVPHLHVNRPLRVHVTLSWYFINDTLYFFTFLTKGECKESV